MKKYIDVNKVIDKLSAAQITAIGDIFDGGDGVERDRKRAIDYFFKGAVLGDAYAQAMIADAYAVGDIMQKSEADALMWYKKSAEQYNPYAQYQYGKRISDDDGGLLWLHLSAHQGFPLAMKELSDRLYRYDPKLSQKWLKKYYSKRNKCKLKNFCGKTYLKELRHEHLPKVFCGEIVVPMCRAFEDN